MLVAAQLALSPRLDARQQALDLALQIEQLHAQLLDLVWAKRVSAIERAAQASHRAGDALLKRRVPTRHRCLRHGCCVGLLACNKPGHGRRIDPDRRGDSLLCVVSALASVALSNARPAAISASRRSSPRAL